MECSDIRETRERRSNTEICKPFFRLWRQRHKAKAAVKLAVERCRIERERLQEEGPLELFLRKYRYMLDTEALSSKVMSEFVRDHRQQLIALDEALYKAANRSSKAGLFAYLNDLIIEGKAHRKRCWKDAPPRRSGALELCDRDGALTN